MPHLLFRFSPNPVLVSVSDCPNNIQDNRWNIVQIKEVKRKQETIIDQNICHRCGSQLAIRHGKYEQIHWL